MKYISNSDNQYAYDILSNIASTGKWDAISYLNDNGDFLHDDFSDSMVLSWEKLLKEIRFINPDNNFDYSTYGDFFFLDHNLYILTDNESYSSFNIKKELSYSKYEYLLKRKKYLIKGLFAGFYIGRRDDYGKRIYYGDILKLELQNFSKCKSCEYFEGPFKDRKTNDIDVIYGPISFRIGWNHCSNPEEPFYIADQAFGVLPNLCMSTNTKIVANVFYDVSFNSNYNFNLDIIYKASLPDSGNYSCQFWNYFVPKDIRESNTTNVIWEYAINEYRKEKVLTNIKPKHSSIAYNYYGGNSYQTKSYKVKIWSKLKRLWSKNP